MKFRLFFKTPGATDELLSDENLTQFGAHESFDPGAEASVEAAMRERDKAEALLSRFLGYDEYVTLEFDTEAGTAIVVPLRS